MWRTFCLAISLFTFQFSGCVGQADAASRAYVAAERDFQGSLTLDQRIWTQVLLIAAGYATAVPTERFSSSILKALKKFETDNGFVPSGHLDKDQIDRLGALGSAKLVLWGFRKVTHPFRPVAIWVPLGLGLDVKATRSGLRFSDRQGRLTLYFLSRQNASVVDVYRGVMSELAGQRAVIHYEVTKDDWFVISATGRDRADRYYRYHQDGPNVTGFALEWNNAAGDVNAERIAVIVSASLRSAMTGAPFVDPPPASEALQARKAPEPQPPPVVVPPAPAPSPPPAPPTATAKSGTGFFVSDNGHFVTNAHVIDGCSNILVKSDDGAITAAFSVATDATNDLAILKLAARPKRVVALRIGVRLGEGVAAFGFPHSDILSTSGNFTTGNVTALSGLHDDSRYLQISAPVQAGNSGGPLLDGDGNLVGVVSAKLNAFKVAVESGDLPQNVNFAVKSAILATFLDASRVIYKVAAPGAKALEPADIADQARAMSGFVVCR